MAFRFVKSGRTVLRGALLAYFSGSNSRSRRKHAKMSSHPKLLDWREVKPFHNPILRPLNSN